MTNGGMGKEIVPAEITLTMIETQDNKPLIEKLMKAGMVHALVDFEITDFKAKFAVLETEMRTLP
jgi:hypothetical protein